MEKRIELRLICSLVVGLCLAPALVICQSNAWELIGPDGGPILTIAQDPANNNILYAATQELPCRIYRSSDHGQSWSNVLSTSQAIFNFLFDRTKPSAVYAHTTYTLYKSLNDGQTWTSTTLPANAVFWTVVIDPANPSVLHAGAQDSVNSNSQWRGAYYKSTDGGSSWSRTLLLADTGGQIKWVSIDPANPQIIYAGGGAIYNGYYVMRIFKSTDGGGTFVDLPPVPNGGVNVIALHPTNARRIYLGGNGGVYTSLDGGNTWAYSFGVFGSVYKIVVDKGTPSIVYAASDVGAYKSTDDGKSWTNLTGDLSNGFGGMIVEQGSSPSIFYANSAGVIRSLDGGTSWQECSNGISAAHISALCIPTLSPRTLYAAFEYNNVYKTNGAVGTTVQWQPLKKFYTCKYICAFANPPNSPDKLYAGEGGQ